LPSDWGLGELAEGSSVTTIAGAGLGTWIAAALVALGAYLILAQAIPGISFLGSLLLLIVGIVLLALNVSGRATNWALYSGAVLAGVGALRVIGELLPVEVHGETAAGVGVALLAIGALRRPLVGGLGWQGMVGAGALGLGVLQFLIGLLPGSPGFLDLAVPVIIIVGGLLLLMRSLDDRTPARR
jgi:hypothetical protein